MWPNRLSSIPVVESAVRIPLDGVGHVGDLAIPDAARGLVLFAHGSGSSRLSPRNRFVASVLQQRGIATLLFDLLTDAEDRLPSARFDIELLTERLVSASAWVRKQDGIGHLSLGLFGASTGAAAALRAAARMGPIVRAVVSRGGRPDLAMDELPMVMAPTRLIVGAQDHDVLALNRAAYAKLRGTREIVTIPGATHLFEEPGTLAQAADSAADWFARYLKSGDARPE